MAETATAEPGAQGTGVDPDFEQIATDYLGGQPATPEPSGADAAGQPTKPATTAPAPEPVAQPAEDRSAQAPTAPGDAGTVPGTQPVPEKKFKFDGVEYTPKTLADAIAKNPDLAIRIATSAEQFPHIKGKYDEAKRLLDEAQTRTAQPPAPQETPQQAAARLRVAQAQLKAAYDPIVKKAVEDGTIESDLADLYPEAVTGMFWMRDRLAAAEQRIAELVNVIQGSAAERQTSDLTGRVVQQLDALAGQGDHFKELSTPEGKQAFWEYLWQLNPTVAQMNDSDFIARQFVAFKKDVVLAAIGSNRQGQQASSDLARRQAVGEGGSPRPAAAPPSTMFGADLLTDDERRRLGG